MNTKTKIPATARGNPSSDTPELVLFSNPPDVLDIVRAGNAAALPTKSLNVFYVLADSIEKGIKALKEKCRPVIIDRRNQGAATGDKLQHREFRYQTAAGDITLTIQERIAQRINREKLETLLKRKELWETATTTTVDMDKVEGLIQAGLITPAELAGVSGKPEPGYALIAKFNAR